MQLFLKKGVVFLFLLTYTIINEGQQETPRTKKGGSIVDILKNIVSTIKGFGGTWEDMIYTDGGEINEFVYDLLLTELGLSNVVSESFIDEKIEAFFDAN